MKVNTILTISVLVIFLFLFAYGLYLDTECMSKGYDGVFTLMYVPVGCYHNHNPLGVNDIRGYEIDGFAHGFTEVD